MPGLRLTSRTTPTVSSSTPAPGLSSTPSPASSAFPTSTGTASVPWSSTSTSPTKTENSNQNQSNPSSFIGLLPFMNFDNYITFSHISFTIQAASNLPVLFSFIYFPLFIFIFLFFCFSAGRQGGRKNTNGRAPWVSISWVRAWSHILYWQVTSLIVAEIGQSIL